ncbi:cytochrome c oxidase assembly protein [Pontibacter harenae]|uniref:cytochrome c oxidase assembly protein n=1 Tax=Pontibacter harenae TaxID=2894083 RepID=UPI001E5654FE|nr:cytochrome c oxidase assembly protein [Pontibacter harenae]MCC9166356.1 cytochrome c oxidase assembly protein [Pontibacter harenae]
MQHHSQHSLPGSSISEWIPLLVIGGVALAYVYAFTHTRKQKGTWNGWHTVSFMCGICLLGVAMLPKLMQWAHQDLRGHMVQHLLIGMFAPLFLVLGAPITLALKALPTKLARNVTAILRSRMFYLVSHPITAFILNIGGMYLLYLTPLYLRSLTNPYLHYAIHLHFLLAGYLFVWSMVGLDPVPKRPSILLRVLVLFVSIAAHAFLSKFMYAYLYPLNSPYSSIEIREAAKLMYYWGDLSELLLTIALFSLWYQKRGLRKGEVVRPVP